MENERSKIVKQDRIFISVFAVIAIALLSSGVYLLATNGSPGMQVVVFVLGGIIGISLISIKLKKGYVTYLLFLILLIIISIYAWKMNIDFDLKIPLGLFWFIMIYWPIWYLKQSKITNYFDTDFKEDLNKYFTNAKYIKEKEESFKIQTHPYIEGDYEEGYIGDRIQGTYKNVDFNIYEYHIQGKKDVWQGSILEIGSIDSDDVVITSKTIINYYSYPNIKMIEKLIGSYKDVSWVVTDGELKVYLNLFKPIFDTRVGLIKNPINQFTTLLDRVIEILE